MSEIRECSTDGCEAFACHGETKCQSCLHDEHRAKQAAPRAPLAVGEAIDLLSLAARSSTWQGADPRLARALLEVLRSETEACFRAQINRDHMRNERDEARAEVERLAAEVASLREGHVYVCSDCLEDQCECGTAQELAEAAHWLSTRAADPKPTPPADVPNVRMPSARRLAEMDGDATVMAVRGPSAPARLLDERDTFDRSALVDLRERCAWVADNAVDTCAAALADEIRGVPLVDANVTRTCARCHGDGYDECRCEHPTPPERPRAKRVERDLEQPAPTGNGAEVFRVAIAECPSVSLAEALKAREAVGIERYGTTLRTHNGRDVVRDLREELADAYVYATQAGMEAGEPPPDHLLRSVRWALVEAWRALEEFERRRRQESP